MEFRIRTKMKGVNRTVVADIPGFGNVRREVEMRVKSDQSAEDEFIA